MFCKNCGVNIPDNSKFCFKCGTKILASIPKISEQESNVSVLKSLIVLKSIDSVVNFFNKFATNNKECLVLISQYKVSYQRDLIPDLIDLSTNYNTIKIILSKFIEHEIVESKYPHKLLSHNVFEISDESTDDKLKINTNHSTIYNNNKANNTFRLNYLPIIIFVFACFIIYTFINKNAITDHFNNDTPSSVIYNTDQVIAAGNFKYQINSTKYLNSIGNDFNKVVADGIFLLIHISLINTDNVVHTLDNSLFRLEDEDGNIFEYSISGSTALIFDRYETLFLKQCNPKISKTGWLIFEVPHKDQYYLHLSGGYWEGETKLVKL